MYNLLHEHGRHLLASPPPNGLGITLPEAEAQLLSRYGLDCDRPESFQVAWKLEEDGYIHPHLVYHLARLNKIDAIEVVLNTETPIGKNGWFQARE